MANEIPTLKEKHQKLLDVFDLSIQLEKGYELCYQCLAGNIFESRESFLETYEEDGLYVLYDNKGQLVDVEAALVDLTSELSALGIGTEVPSFEEAKRILELASVEEKTPLKKPLKVGL